VVCATSYFGQNPNAYFNTVGRSFLFCLVKGESGFTMMSPQQSQSALQQMRLNQQTPSPLVTDKLK
jgi:hypothetical protein